MSCAAPMTIMNMIVGKQLREFYQDVEIHKSNNMPQDQAILMVLKRYIYESKAIRFEGDGYSQNWKDEAERRGLGNYPDTPRALQAYQKKRKLYLWKVAPFTGGIRSSLRQRIENYTKLQIESRTLAEICMNQVLPAAIGYQNT